MFGSVSLMSMVPLRTGSGHLNFPGCKGSFMPVAFLTYSLLLVEADLQWAETFGSSSLVLLFAGKETEARK